MSWPDWIISCNLTQNQCRGSDQIRFVSSTHWFECFALFTTAAMQLHATCRLHPCMLDHIKHCRNSITHHRRETASAFKTEQTHSSESLSARLESNTQSGEKERSHSCFGTEDGSLSMRGFSLSVCVCVCVCVSVSVCVCLCVCVVPGAERILNQQFNHTQKM